MRFSRSSLAVAAVGLLLAAGCSNNGPGAQGTGGGSGGGDIKLLVLSQLQAASFSFPEIADGAQAAAASVNAAGGVNGHKIIVDVCNDQGDPNVAATCGRKAVQEGYSAVLNGVSLYAASYMPLLEAASVPAVGGSPLTPPDFTSPMSFPTNGGNPLDYGGAGYFSGKTGCKSTVLIRDTAAAVEETTKAMTTGAQLSGAPVQAVIKQAGTSTDFSAPVSQAVATNADCMLLAEQPAAVAKIVGSVRQSSKPTMPIYTNVAGFPAVLAKSLGPAANGVRVNSSQPLPTPQATPTFLADMQKYSPNAPVSTQSLLGWAGVQVIKQVGAKADGTDHTAILKALQSSTAVTIEGYPQTFNFSQPRAGQYPRIFATSNYGWEYRDGDYQPEFDGKPVDVSAVLG